MSHQPNAVPNILLRQDLMDPDWLHWQKQPPAGLAQQRLSPQVMNWHGCVFPAPPSPASLEEMLYCTSLLFFTLPFWSHQTGSGAKEALWLLEHQIRGSSFGCTTSGTCPGHLRQCSFMATFLDTLLLYISHSLTTPLWWIECHFHIKKGSPMASLDDAVHLREPWQLASSVLEHPFISHAILPPWEYA